MSKCYLLCIYGITTHYSSHHHNYYFSAWLYVTESDREFKECSGHPERHNQGEPCTDLGEEKGLEDDKKQGRDGDVTLKSDASEPDQNKKKNNRKLGTCLLLKCLKLS